MQYFGFVCKNYAILESYLAPRMTNSHENLGLVEEY